MSDDFTVTSGSIPVAAEALAADVEVGLDRVPRSLHCRWFYDERGARLFEEICRQPEYYLPRVERQILHRIGPEVAARYDEAPEIVELGCGNCEKTALILKDVLDRFDRATFVPVDICLDSLRGAAKSLLRELPGLRIEACHMEYGEAIRALALRPSAHRLVLWLGSNIGNFHRPDAAEFLLSLGLALTPGDEVMLGMDLRKDVATLEAAYDDAAGVTAAFNRNILDRVNRDLDGDFDPGKFDHRATWDEDNGRIDMWLVSRAAQRVRIGLLDREFSFAEGEAIHTECSYKYSTEEIEGLAAASGFDLDRVETDDGRRFATVLLRRR